MLSYSLGSGTLQVRTGGVDKSLRRISKADILVFLKCYSLFFGLLNAFKRYKKAVSENSW